MQNSTKRRTLSNAGTLTYLLKDSLLLFIISILASAAFTFFSTIIPQVVSFAINYVIGEKELPESFSWLAGLFGGLQFLKENMWLLAAMIAAIAVFAAISAYLRMYINTRATQSFMRRMRNKLFSHVQRLPLSWHTEHRTGDIIQRCTSDADTICNFVSNQLINLFRIVILIIFSLTFMFLMNVKLALIAAVFVPVFIISGYLFHRYARKHFQKCDENEGILSTLAQENFTGVRVVRAFGREKYERDKFEKQNVYYTGLWLKILNKMAVYWTLNNFIAAAQGMLMVVVGTVFCVQGRLSAGEFVAFITYNAMLMGPVRELGRIISNMSKAGVSLGRIAEILNAEEEDYGEEAALSGDIELKDVSFSYEDGKPVLKDVSVKIPQGTTLGIIGASGSGKSTLVQLLVKLMPLSGGDIIIGGKSFKDIPLATLRSNIGLVLQESYIYTRTVGENIAIAADGASQENIEGAARCACVDENIRGFANGYDTVVGERGVTLSGGQKQRVAIARTLMRKTPYIVFDDSLSAVDSETDFSIRANLKERNAGATTIIISHRITTVMHADNIIVLDGGKITERGTHAELLAAGGLYKRIYEVQLSLPDELKEEVRNG